MASYPYPQPWHGELYRLLNDFEALRAIRRSMLEYPTEDVNFIYLSIIGKLSESLGKPDGWFAAQTLDSFTDKAVQDVFFGDFCLGAFARIAGANDYYGIWQNTAEDTADAKIYKSVNGIYPSSEVMLATEAVDLNPWFSYFYILSATGSTLKMYRWHPVESKPSTPNITTTDTSYASGAFGVHGKAFRVENSPGITPNPGTGVHFSLNFYYQKLLAPLSPLPRCMVLLEVELEENVVKDFAGNPVKRRSPKLASLVKQADNGAKVDVYAVSWGLFDARSHHALLMVKGENPYLGLKAVDAQIEYAKSKSLAVFKPPLSVQDVEDLHRAIRARFDLVAGKHDLAYQIIGHEDLEPLAVADFYDGCLQGSYGRDPFKNVPQWELERTIKRWLELCRKSRVKAELREKHEKKLLEVLKR